MFNLLTTTNLPEWAIALIIVGAVIGSWFLLLITDVIFVLTFRTILKKHVSALTVILNTKYINLTKIFQKAKDNGIELSDRLKEILSKMDEIGFTKHDSKLGEEMRAYLSYLGEEAKHIILRNKSLLDDPEMEIIQTNLKDIEIQLRSAIAMYNADVLGFNYWINFLPTRIVYKLFKIKKKELIS